MSSGLPEPVCHLLHAAGLQSLIMTTIIPPPLNQILTLKDIERHLNWCGVSFKQKSLDMTTIIPHPLNQIMILKGIERHLD